MSEQWEYEQEAAYEQFIEELSRELYPEHIDEFISERLASFYVANPLVAESSFRTLVEARLFLPTHPTAAHIFAAIAIEVGLKVTLLKPIVYGFVTSESVAGILADRVARTRLKDDKFRNLLFQLFHECSGVNFKTFRRTKSSKAIWNEVKDVMDRRDRIMHRAELASEDEAKQAVDVASTILEALFPVVVKAFGFHVHEDGLVCNRTPCDMEGLL